MSDNYSQNQISQLLNQFNELCIPNMDPVTELNEVKGKFINLELPLPDGKKAKFWNDHKIYLANQMHRQGTHRCYGLVADEVYLMVCEYGDDCADPEIVVLKKWN